MNEPSGQTFHSEGQGSSSIEVPAIPKSHNKCSDFGTFDLAERFEVLVENWKNEIGGVSSLSQITSNKNYLAVIALGPQVIPLILEELRAEPAPWFAALSALSGRDDVGRGFPGRFRKMADAWIQWGIEQGYIS
jgi:hypothetical protein